MQIIDFSKLDRQRLNTTMIDLGMVDFNNLPFLDVLERLGVSSDRPTEENFPLRQSLQKVDLSKDVQQLWQTKKIADTIGSTKVFTGAAVYFSTLLSAKPKEYLKQYIDVARCLCKPANNLEFVVWLEDTLTTLKNDWDDSTIQEAIDAYQFSFTREFPECQIMLSSKVIPIGIPQGFVKELSAITIEEFLSVLPFHLRNPMFVKTLDIVHFVCNCYLLHRLTGIHLGGINNKRHFQLFRKVVGSQVTAILLPLGSESLLI